MKEDITNPETFEAIHKVIKAMGEVKIPLELDTQILDWSQFRFSHYRMDETCRIKPQLEALGFKNIEFYDIEKDSFGPLVRGIRMERHGIKYTASYG